MKRLKIGIIALVAAVVAGLPLWVAAQEAESPQAEKTPQEWSHDHGEDSSWEEWGEHWAEWGEQFGEHFARMGEEMGEAWGERGEEWGEHWAELGEKWGEEWGEKWGEEWGERWSHEWENKWSEEWGEEWAEHWTEFADEMAAAAVEMDWEGFSASMEESMKAIEEIDWDEMNGEIERAMGGNGAPARGSRGRTRAALRRLRRGVVKPNLHGSCQLCG